MKLYGKLILLSSLLVALTCLPLYYFVSTEAEKKLQEQTATQLTALAESIIDDLDRFFYERKADLAQLAEEDIFRREDSTAIASRLHDVRNQNLLTASCSYFDLNRLRIFDTENASVGKIHSNTKYWSLLNDSSGVVNDVSFSESLGEIVLHFAAYTRNREGEKQGVIVSRVLISRMYEIFSRDLDGQIFEKSGIDVMDEELKLLYSNYNPEGVLKQKYANTEVIDFFRKNNKRFYQSGEKVYFTAVSQGYLNHKGNHWRVIISLPADIAFMQISDLQNQMLITMFAILVLAILLALAFAKIISSPIVLLSKAAESLGAGQDDVNFSIDSSDEIGLLAESLKKMAKNLKNTIEEQKLLNEKLNSSNDDLALKVKQTEEQKLHIEEQTVLLQNALEEIKRTTRAMTDSIKYAERIQRSMLPEKELRDEAFQQSFILFLPRDIVSGDFYWFDAVQSNGKNYFIVAAADCTGHGVPGGFMALLGANLLNTIVNIEKIVTPELVLNELNKEIKRALHQETHGENIRDGMEIALCTIDYELQKICFAGAGRPFVRFRKGEMTLIEANHYTVGGVDTFLQKRKLTFQGFTGETIDFEHGDNIYLFSDGFKDQFGGENNRKYSQKRFLEKLTAIQNFSMREQKREMENEFFEWKGENKQTDDILVLGFTL